MEKIQLIKFFVIAGIILGLLLVLALRSINNTLKSIAKQIEDFVSTTTSGGVLGGGPKPK